MVIYEMLNKAETEAKGIHKLLDEAKRLLRL